MMAEDCLPKTNAAASGIGNSSNGSLASTRKTATSGEASDASSASGGGSNSATSESAEKRKNPESSTSKNISEYLDSFIKSVEETLNVKGINDTTRELNNVDCSEVVYDFIAANVPGFSTAMSWINKGADILKKIGSGDLMSGALGGNQMVQSICDVLSMAYGTAIAYIEVFIKGAFVLFKKIDALRARLENALLNLTDAIQRCILDVLDDLVAKLKQLLKLSLTIDWNALLKLMRDCPCLTQVVATLTNCRYDDDGNYIGSNPTAVIMCIQDRLSFLDPSALCAGLEKMYENYVRKYVKIVFGYIGSWIVYVFTTLIKPLRAAIKKYAEGLTYKFNVDAMLDAIGPYQCFFSYTYEYDNGSKYRGMSVIDFINTFKQWIPCIQHACPAFSEKIKNRCKEIYKDLRLDDKYWRNAYEMDLFVICIGAKADAETPRETTLRSLYNESPVDLILAWWRSRNKKGDDDETVDNPEEPIESIPSPEEIEKYKAEHDGQLPPNTPNDFTQSVKFTDSPETENEINVGEQAIGAGEENYIRDIIRNLGNGNGSFFTEKLYQLIRLMNFYHTSPKFVRDAQEAIDHVENIPGDFRVRKSTLRYSNQRPSKDYEIHDVHVTYEIPNDYDEELCNRIQSADIYLMKRGSSESRIDFYSRMYAKAVAE